MSDQRAVHVPGSYPALFTRAAYLASVRRTFELNAMLPDVEPTTSFDVRCEAYRVWRRFWSWETQLRHEALLDIVVCKMNKRCLVDFVTWMATQNIDVLPVAEFYSHLAVELVVVKETSCLVSG